MTAEPGHLDVKQDPEILPPMPRDEAGRLAAVRATQLLDSLPEQAFDDLTRLAAIICDTPISLVTLLDAERVWFKAGVGMPPSASIPRRLAFCAYTVCSDELFVVEDALGDPRFLENPMVAGEPRIRFYAGAPLITREGHTLGTLCVLDKEPRQLNAQQRHAVQALSRQVIYLIELREAQAQAERALREQKQAQADMEDFFSEAPALLGITDRRGRLLRFNPTWTETLGYDREGLCSEPLARRIHPADQHSARQRLRAMDEGKPVDGFACRYRTSSGAYRTLSWFAKVSRDGQRVHAIAQDITERMRTERLQSELVATVSHELRTPLTAILGALELLANQVTGPMTPGGLDLVEIAGRNARQLRQLVNELLDLERMEVGQSELRLQPARVDHLVREMHQTLSALSLDRGVRLESEADELTLLCDRARLRQVLMNLGSNAIKHAGQDSTVRIRAGALERPARIRIEVLDRGPGVPDDEHDRIFERFVQGKGIRSDGGSGLGLAISKAIVERHGGSIGVLNREGGGACFWLELPWHGANPQAPAPT